MRIEKKWAVKSAPNKLSDNQMKHVVAGYGDGYDGATVCYWEMKDTNGDLIKGCTNNREVAREFGWDDHWECNTTFAYDFCKNHL